MKFVPVSPSLNTNVIAFIYSFKTNTLYFGTYGHGDLLNSLMRKDRALYNDAESVYDEIWEGRSDSFHGYIYDSKPPMIYPQMGLSDEEQERRKAFIEDITPDVMRIIANQRHNAKRSFGLSKRFESVSSQGGVSIPEDINLSLHFIRLADHIYTDKQDQNNFNNYVYVPAYDTVFFGWIHPTTIRHLIDCGVPQSILYNCTFGWVNHTGQANFYSDFARDEEAYTNTESERAIELINAYMASKSTYPHQGSPFRVPPEDSGYHTFSSDTISQVEDILSSDIIAARGRPRLNKIIDIADEVRQAFPDFDYNSTMFKGYFTKGINTPGIYYYRAPNGNSAIIDSWINTEYAPLAGFVSYDTATGKLYVFPQAKKYQVIAEEWVEQIKNQPLDENIIGLARTVTAEGKVAAITAEEIQIVPVKLGEFFFGYEGNWVELSKFDQDIGRGAYNAIIDGSPETGGIIGSIAFEPVGQKILISELYVEPEYRGSPALMKLYNAVSKLGLPIMADFENSKLEELFTKLKDKGRIAKLDYEEVPPDICESLDSYGAYQADELDGYIKAVQDNNTVYWWFTSHYAPHHEDVIAYYGLSLKSASLFQVSKGSIYAWPREEKQEAIARTLQGFLYQNKVAGEWAWRIPFLYDAETDQIYWGDIDTHHTTLYEKLHGKNTYFEVGAPYKKDYVMGWYDKRSGDFNYYDFGQLDEETKQKAIAKAHETFDTREPILLPGEAGNGVFFEGYGPKVAAPEIQIEKVELNDGYLNFAGYLDDYDKYAEHNGLIGYNAYIGEELIGSITFRHIEAWIGDTIYVEEVFVKPEYRTTNALRLLYAEVAKYNLPIDAEFANTRLYEIYQRLKDRGKIASEVYPHVIQTDPRVNDPSLSLNSPTFMYLNGNVYLGFTHYDIIQWILENELKIESYDEIDQSYFASAVFGWINITGENVFIDVHQSDYVIEEAVPRNQKNLQKNEKLAMDILKEYYSVRGYTVKFNVNSWNGRYSKVEFLHDPSVKPYFIETFMKRQPVVYEEDTDTFYIGMPGWEHWNVMNAMGVDEDELHGSPPGLQFGLIMAGEVPQWKNTDNIEMWNTEDMSVDTELTNRLREQLSVADPDHFALSKVASSTTWLEPDTVEGVGFKGWVYNNNDIVIWPIDANGYPHHHQGYMEYEDDPDDNPFNVAHADDRVWFMSWPAVGGVQVYDLRPVSLEEKEKRKAEIIPWIKEVAHQGSPHEDSPPKTGHTTFKTGGISKISTIVNIDSEPRYIALPELSARKPAIWEGHTLYVGSPGSEHADVLRAMNDEYGINLSLNSCVPISIWFAQANRYARESLIKIWNRVAVPELIEELKSFGLPIFDGFDERVGLNKKVSFKIPEDSRKELDKFWHDHPDLRAECKDKYGYDPIDEEADYWKHGLKEPEHRAILKAVGNKFILDLVKKWEKQELEADKTSSLPSLKEIGEEWGWTRYLDEVKPRELTPDITRLEIPGRNYFYAWIYLPVNDHLYVGDAHPLIVSWIMEYQPELQDSLLDATLGWFTDPEHSDFAEIYEMDNPAATERAQELVNEYAEIGGLPKVHFATKMGTSYTKLVDPSRETSMNFKLGTRFDYIEIPPDQAKLLDRFDAYEEPDNEMIKGFVTTDNKVYWWYTDGQCPHHLDVVGNVANWKDVKSVFSLDDHDVWALDANGINAHKDGQEAGQLLQTKLT